MLGSNWQAFLAQNKPKNNPKGKTKGKQESKSAKGTTGIPQGEHKVQSKGSKRKAADTPGASKAHQKKHKQQKTKKQTQKKTQTPAQHISKWEPAQPSECDRFLEQSECANDPRAPLGSSLQGEVKRFKAVVRLAESFQQLCGAKLGSRKWFVHFESWLWARRAQVQVQQQQQQQQQQQEEEEAHAHVVDPVLPSGPWSRVDPELLRKLLRAGVQQADAEAVCKKLGELSTAEAHALTRELEGPDESGLQVEVVHVEQAGGDPARVEMQCGGVKLGLNTRHYRKLLHLFNLHADSVDKGSSTGTGVGSGEASAAATSAIFCCLARYQAVCGGQMRAGGMQAAIHEECFDTLHDDFGVTMECFASPFNCRYGRHCSAFLDVDRCFGSMGSFFQFHPSTGSLQANPPFDPCTINRMRAHMETLLLSKEPLSFVVIVPCWSEEAGDPQRHQAWRGLLESSSCRHHLHLPQAHHGYCEGSQHVRTNQYRTANSDSSVFFLQNASASKAWPVTQAKISRLMAKFKPKKSTT